MLTFVCFLEAFPELGTMLLWSTSGQLRECKQSQFAWASGEQGKQEEAGEPSKRRWLTKGGGEEE